MLYAKRKKGRSKNGNKNCLREDGGNRQEAGSSEILFSRWAAMTFAIYHVQQTVGGALLKRKRHDGKSAL